jgi:lambda repressor-like predicted transcriptional regulator
MARVARKSSTASETMANLFRRNWRRKIAVWVCPL